jgi:hypothetical protein
MTLARTLAVLGASLTLAACVAGPPPGPTAMVFPGKDKSAADFQQDQAVCRQHALAQTGYGNVSPAAPAAAPNPAETPAQSADNGATEPSSDLSFIQCMAARGNTVQIVSAPGDPDYAYTYPYPAYPYPYAYGYGYGYDYPFAYPYFGTVIGFGGRFHDGFHHHGFHHDGFHGSGFQGGFHGAGFHGDSHGGGHGGHR